MSLLPFPVIVVSYADDSITALSSALESNDVVPAVCRTFCEAESLVLEGLYCGILIDLPSIVKAKGEEKIVAYTLANFFPTLRVRSMGTMLVPMTMSGGAKQDKSLKDFLAVTCAAFEPRKIRSYRRHNVCLSVLVSHNGEESRSFTLNLSWGGLFMVDTFVERFSIGDEVEIRFPELNLSQKGTVRWIHGWGERRAPGAGICFHELHQDADAVLSPILKTSRGFDRDRLVT